MLWNAFQRFGVMLLSFVSNIVLAWLLVPEDFGCIGMLSIFIAVSEVFIDGGFGSALIQKKGATQEDFSTIFYWNLAVSSVLFVALQFLSPMLAGFYHLPALTNILRVTSIVLLINGFSVIQTTILTKELSFKLIAKINVFSTLIGVMISIGAAYIGFGVWSLVIKTLLSALITAILLWTLNNWRPSWCFSIKSFKELFKFGGLMLLSSLLNTLFENIQGLVIGRFYTPADLGYYSQAKKLDDVPSKSISQIVTQVSFPAFSKIADNPEHLRNYVRKNIICTTYLIFPLQILLILLSEDLIVFLFGTKWICSVLYFRILCVYSMFISLNAINTNLYKAMGRSDVYFWVQLSKKVLGISLLIIGLNYGVEGVTWSVSVSGILWWVISAAVNGRLIGYGLFRQLLDIVRSLLLALAVGAVLFYLSCHLSFMLVVEILLYSVFFFGAYVLLSSLLQLEPYKVFRAIVIEYYDRIRKHK